MQNGVAFAGPSSPITCGRPNAKEHDRAESAARIAPMRTAMRLSRTVNIFPGCSHYATRLYLPPSLSAASSPASARGFGDRRSQ